MPRAVHFGPIGSKGGMSSVIVDLIENAPEGWSSDAISTHSDTLAKMIFQWVKSRKELKRAVKGEKIDIAHVHVTHSLSWWRKRGILRICDKLRIPSVVHIHSGKFDHFCSGLSGISVKKELSRPSRIVVVLEDRWKDRLSKWLPENTKVVYNSTNLIVDRSEHNLDEKIKLLLLSRHSRIKGHNFAIKIIEKLNRDKIPVSLIMTGVTEQDFNEGELPENVDCVGWVSEMEKQNLLSKADILLSPSEYEGSSMSIIEGIVNGLPCLVSDVSAETVGLEDLVVSGYDEEQWANRIIRLSEPKRYRECVVELLHYSERYSREKNKEAIGEIYKHLMEIIQQ